MTLLLIYCGSNSSKNVKRVKEVGDFINNKSHNIWFHKDFCYISQPEVRKDIFEQGIYEIISKDSKNDRITVVIYDITNNSDFKILGSLGDDQLLSWARSATHLA